MPIVTAEPKATPPTDRLITAEEFAEHPEWGPCELICGKVIPLTNPKPIHGVVSAELAFCIQLYIRPKQLGAVFVNDTGIVIQRGPDTVRGPDVGFIRWNRLPNNEIPEKYFEVPPDLCAEVISPTDTWTKVTEKVEMYLDIGVPLVWAIDPQTRKARVYRKGRETIIIEPTGALDGEDILPGFSLPLSELFAVLK